MRKLTTIKPVVVSLIGFSHKLRNTAIEEEVFNGDTYAENKRLNSVIKAVEEFRIENDIPGMAVCISLDGKTIIERGFGWDDLENQIKARADMRANIASITKLFTTHLYTKLSRTSNLPLERNIGRYIPQLRREMWILNPETKQYIDYQRNKYPIKWLMTHQAGFRHPNLAEHYYRGEDYPNMMDVLLDRVQWSPTGSLIHTWLKNWPGDILLYSSMNLDILGAICEKVAGRGNNFYDLMSDLTQELELQNTYLDQVKLVNFNKSCGYDYLLEKSSFGVINCYNGNFIEAITGSRRGSPLYNRACTNMSAFHSSEGLISTVGDLIKFGNLYLKMFNGEGGPFTQEEVENMWSKHVKGMDIYIKDAAEGLFSGRANCTGLEWSIETIPIDRNIPKLRTVVGHGGSAFGYKSLLSITWVSEEDRTTIEGTPVINGPDCPWDQGEDNLRPPSQPSSRIKNDCKGLAIAVIGNVGFTGITEISKIISDLFLDKIDVET